MMNETEMIGRFKKPVKQKLLEFIEFCKEIKKINPEIIVEIGVLRGGITSQFVGKVKQVIGIDIENGKSDYVIVGNSHDIKTVELLKGRLMGDIDVLFIDGDHSYEGVSKDYELYNPFVRKGGIIAFHDIINSAYHKKYGCGVNIFWKELKTRYKYKEIFDHFDPDWGGIGIIYV